MFFSHASEDFVKAHKVPENYRDAEITHTKDFSVRQDLNPDRSIGMPMIGRAVRSMKGQLLLSGNVCLEGKQIYGDSIPGDLPKLLAFFKEAEVQHEDSHEPGSLTPCTCKATRQQTLGPPFALAIIT